MFFFFFFSSRRRHTRLQGDWSSDVCSSDLAVRGRGAEQRELLADGRVGVDAVLDVQRTEDRTVAGEGQHAQLPVVGRVGASGDPADHVVTLTAERGHRYKEHE